MTSEHKGSLQKWTLMTSTTCKGEMPPLSTHPLSNTINNWLPYPDSRCILLKREIVSQIYTSSSFLQFGISVVTAYHNVLSLSVPGSWWQSKSALNQSRHILFFMMASCLFMSQFTLASHKF